MYWNAPGPSFIQLILAVKNYNPIIQMKNTHAHVMDTCVVELHWQYH